MKPLLFAAPLALAFSLAPSLASDAADAIGFDTLAEELSAVGAAEAAFIRRSKLRKKRTVGYRVVVVVGDDATNNEVNTVDVTIPHVPGQPTPAGGTTECSDDGNCSTTVTLPLKVVKANGNKRFVFNDLDFSEDAANLAYSGTATMKDINDLQVGPSVDFTTEVVDAEMDIRTVTIQQLDDVNFKMRTVVVGDFANEVDQVWACIDDYTGPDPEPDDCFTLTDPAVNGGKKTFSLDTVTFSDPSAAADEVYSMIVTTVRADQSVIANAEFDVVVLGLEVDQIAELEAALDVSEQNVAALNEALANLTELVAQVDAAFTELEFAAEEQPDAPISTFGDLVNHTRTRIQATVHFIDDWNGETAW